MTLETPAGSLLGKIAGYVEILVKDPRSTVFVSLAESYRQMGMLDEALEVATKGVQVLSSFCPGYAVLGRIQIQLGNLDAAAAAFERALLIEPENLISLKGLARARMQQGDRARALELVQRAVALKPDDAVAQKMLAAMGATGSAPVAAIPTAPQSLVGAVHPQVDPISTLTIADIYIRQGFFGRAMKVYRDLLQADPHNDEIRQKLVELKQRIEGQRAAATPFESVVAVMEDVPPVPAAEVTTATETAAQTTETSAPQLAELTRWLDAISRRRADVR